MLVIALNSAPVIFYPTRTRSRNSNPGSVFRTADGNYACKYRWPLGRSALSHFGIVAEWLVQVTRKQRAARGSNPREGLTTETTLTDTVPALCRCRKPSNECRRRVGAGGQTGTEAWRRQRPTLNNQAASKMLGLQHMFTWIRHKNNSSLR